MVELTHLVSDLFEAELMISVLSWAESEKLSTSNSSPTVIEWNNDVERFWCNMIWVISSTTLDVKFWSLWKRVISLFLKHAFIILYVLIMVCDNLHRQRPN